jgi:methionyl-tRNA formyltransferase
VKPLAEQLGIPVMQPGRVRDLEAVTALRALSPEILVVVAYGQILPKAVLDLAPRGAVNVHGSLLPRWRGAAPIQWAIAAGDTETGVTTMLLDEGLDTGPILLARPTPIGLEETAADLLPRLAELGAELLLSTLAGLEDGSLRPRPQDSAKATKARLLEKEDGRIDWRLSAGEVACRLRGFFPWPGSFTQLEGRGLKVLRARVETEVGQVSSEREDTGALGAGGSEPSGSGAPSPGTVTRLDDEGIVVACGGATFLRLIEVQPDSRKPVAASAFALGARLRKGARFA